jgi:hypothetical protein
LALRPVLEPAIAPYYLWPTFALSLVLVAAHAKRFAVVASVVVAMFLALQNHLGPWWVWYSAAVVGLGVAIAAGGRVSRRWEHSPAPRADPRAAEPVPVASHPVSLG